MRQVVLLAKFLSLLLSHSIACASTIEVRLSGFACIGGAHSVKLPSLLSELEGLGAIRSQAVLRTEKWDGYSAVEKVIHFQGLTLQVITFSNAPSRYVASMVAIDESRWEISPYRVGVPSSPVLAKLGLPKAPATGAWRFNGETDALYIQAYAGKVRRVVYECYTG